MSDIWTKVRDAVVSIVVAIRAWWASVPSNLKLFIRDAIEGAIAAVAALNLAPPGSIDEAKAQALTVVVAVGAAVIAAARRYLLPLVFGG